MVGQLRVGMVPLASLNPMQLIKPLAGKYPELQFSLLSLTSEQIIDGVSRNPAIWGICYLHHASIASFSTLSETPASEWGCRMINAIFSLPKVPPDWGDAGRITAWFLTKVHYRESIEMF